VRKQALFFWYTGVVKCGADRSKKADQTADAGAAADLGAAAAEASAVTVAASAEFAGKISPKSAI